MPAKATKPAKSPAARRGRQAENLALFEQLPIGVFRATLEGEPLYGNSAVARMLGYNSIEDLVASVRNVPQELFQNPKDNAAFRKKLEAKAQAHFHRVPLKHRSGKIIYCEIDARLIKDSKGKGLYVEGTALDVSDHWKNEQTILHLNANLEETVQQRTAEFAAVNKSLKKQVLERKRVEKELKQLIERESKRKEELEKLSHVSQALRQAKQSTDFVQMLNCEIRDLCQADLVAGILFKGDQPPVITCNKSDQQVITSAQQDLIRGILINARSDRPLPKLPEFGTLILKRLRASEGIHGAVLIASRAEDAFDQDERNMIAAVTDMAGVALQRIDIFETLETQAEARRKGLVVLYNLMTMISEGMKLQDILELSLVLTLETIRIDKGILYLVEEADGVETLKPVAERWTSENVSASDLRDNLAQKVLETKKEVIVDDLCDQPAYADVRACCYAGIPIHSRGKMRGAFSLFADEDKKFNAEVLALLASISDHVGIGIENAILIEKTASGSSRS